MTNTDLPHTAANRPSDDLPGAASISRPQTESEAPLPADARALLEKATRCVDEAQGFTDQGLRGPASMKVRAAERELMGLFSTFADISPDHPQLLEISERIAGVKSILSSAPATPVPSTRSHVPTSRPARAPAPAPNAPSESSLRAAIPALRNALLKAHSAYQQASEQTMQALQDLPPNGSTQWLEGFLRETRRSQQRALLLVKTLRANYPNLHGMLQSAPEAVVLIRLIQLIEEADAAWTRTERSVLEERAIGARTVRATAEQFQQESQGRPSVTRAAELQLEYLQWYCDLLSLLQPMNIEESPVFHASAIDVAGEVADHRAFIDDARAAR